MGYNGGLFDISFRADGTKTVDTIVVILSTPTEAALCTGAGYGLQFANCVPGPNKGYMAVSGPAGGYAANSTFAGFATGKGPGSAIVGQNYTVTITANYSDGTSAQDTFSVQATAGG